MAASGNISQPRVGFYAATFPVVLKEPPTHWMPGRGYYRLQELRCGINRRGFAANPRPIPTAESEILLVPAEVGIVAVIGSAKTSMMGAGVVVGCGGVRSDRPAAFIPGCKGGAGYGSGQDSNSGKHSEFGHLISFPMNYCDEEIRRLDSCSGVTG
jgi:hypothetical protein